MHAYIEFLNYFDELCKIQSVILQFYIDEHKENNGPYFYPSFRTA